MGQGKGQGLVHPVDDMGTGCAQITGLPFKNFRGNGPPICARSGSPGRTGAPVPEAWPDRFVIQNAGHKGDFPACHLLGQKRCQMFGCLKVVGPVDQDGR